MIKLELKRGDTLRGSFALKDKVTGQPIDLTGCSFRMQVRTKQKQLLADLSSDAGNIVCSDPPSGVVSVEIDKDVTATFPITTVFYDLETTFSDGYRISTETIHLKILPDETWTAS